MKITPASEPTPASDWIAVAHEVALTHWLNEWELAKYLAAKSLELRSADEVQVIGKIVAWLRREADEWERAIRADNAVADMVATCRHYAVAIERGEWRTVPSNGTDGGQNGT
jgi:hypothetical protein